MTKFKFGDRIRIIAKDESDGDEIYGKYEDIMRGDEGRIINHISRGYYMIFINGRISDDEVLGRDMEFTNIMKDINKFKKNRKGYI